MKQKNPLSVGVTFVIPTFNSEGCISECLKSIRKQEYPQQKVHILLVDGGSTDRTLEIAQKFRIRLISENSGNPETATAIGYNAVRSEYVVNMPSDNVLPHANWLGLMLYPLQQDRSIIATQSQRYAYLKSDSILNRYFALFGVNDPVPYYLNKRDRMSYQESRWNLMGKARDKGSYFRVVFNPKELPTLGANGCVFKTRVIQKTSSDIHRFFHIDACLDLAKQGLFTYGIVKTEIIHKTGETFGGYFKRRFRYFHLYWDQKNKRRYRVFDSGDYGKLFMFVVFSLTLIEPFIQSLRGYRKIRDRAWFLHPFMCLGTVLLYGYAVFFMVCLQEKMKGEKE